MDQHQLTLLLVKQKRRSRKPSLESQNFATTKFLIVHAAAGQAEEKIQKAVPGVAELCNHHNHCPEPLKWLWCRGAIGGSRSIESLS